MRVSCSREDDRERKGDTCSKAFVLGKKTGNRALDSIDPENSNWFTHLGTLKKSSISAFSYSASEEKGPSSAKSE